MDCLPPSSDLSVAYRSISRTIDLDSVPLQIMNLRMGLLEAVHRNEELSELLVQKEQQLEQQDKTSRAQARVIKVTRFFLQSPLIKQPVDF